MSEFERILLRMDGMLCAIALRGIFLFVKNAQCIKGRIGEISELFFRRKKTIDSFFILWDDKGGSLERNIFERI